MNSNDSDGQVWLNYVTSNVTSVWRHWPDECKSARLYFSESLVSGKSHDEPEDSANDRRKSGGRMAVGPRSRNDIELRRPSLIGR